VTGGFGLGFPAGPGGAAPEPETEGPIRQLYSGLSVEKRKA